MPGYVPGDWSGDYLYQLIEASSLAMAMAAIAKMISGSKDDLSTEDGCTSLVFIAVAAVAAYQVHPCMNYDFYPDAAWAFSVYLEVFAMLPQLLLLAKGRREVEATKGLSHFIACTFASKCSMVRFFAKNYVVLPSDEDGKNVTAGVAVLGSYLRWY